MARTNVHGYQVLKEPQDATYPRHLRYLRLQLQSLVLAHAKRRCDFRGGDLFSVIKHDARGVPADKHGRVTGAANESEAHIAVVEIGKSRRLCQVRDGLEHVGGFSAVFGGAQQSKRAALRLATVRSAGL